MCHANYPTWVLGEVVRDRGLLTRGGGGRHDDRPPGARHYGLRHRGRVAEGWHADLVVFDPARIDSESGPPAWLTCRVAASCLVAGSLGVAHVLVAGTEVVADGTDTGAGPGPGAAGARRGHRHRDAGRRQAIGAPRHRRDSGVPRCRSTRAHDRQGEPPGLVVGTVTGPDPRRRGGQRASSLLGGPGFGSRPQFGAWGPASLSAGALPRGTARARPPGHLRPPQRSGAVRFRCAGGSPDHGRGGDGPGSRTWYRRVRDQRLEVVIGELGDGGHGLEQPVEPRGPDRDRRMGRVRFPEGGGARARGDGEGGQEELEEIRALERGGGHGSEPTGLP